MIPTGPDGQPLPFAFRWAVANGLTTFTPWSILESREVAEALTREFRLETGRDVWVFARRCDMDDVAAFEVIGGEVQDRVLFAHLSWKQAPDPYVAVEPYAGFWAWLTERAIPDMVEWTVDDRDIEDVLELRARRAERRDLGAVSGPHPMTDPDDLRRRARFLMIAAVVVDLAGVLALLLPVLQGGGVMTALPLAVVLFVAASGLLVASMSLRRKADAAE